jgi:SAM-dependent methyltransferase
MVGGSQNRDYRKSIYESYAANKKLQNSIAHSEKDFQDWAAVCTARVLDWLPADRQTPVLDMGCGPGYFLYLLDRLGYTDLTGVDLSLSQIAIARRWCPRAKIVQGDAREVLARNSGRFGLIAGFDFIEHFSKDEVLPLLNLVVQALRTGGCLILQTPNAESRWVGGTAYGDFTHEWFFTPSSLGAILSEAGLVGFAARPCRPYVHGLKSFARAFLWNFLDLSMTLVNLIEIGRRGSGINTRVFLATAMKPPEAGPNYV